jgi:hypothetical protein
MSDPIFWSNVQVKVGATHATPLVITGISKANPAVVTYTAGIDPTAGDFVILPDTAGMVELKNRVFRIANVVGASDTFELEGEDSTGYSNFISGTAVPVSTFDSMSTVQDITASGGDPEFADVTTIHDQIRRRVPTVFSPSSYAFGCIFDPGDAAMKRLVALTKSRTPEAVVFTFSDGAEFSFYAYAASSGAPIGSAQEVVKTNVSLESQGLPNVYGA